MQVQEKEVQVQEQEGAQEEGQRAVSPQEEEEKGAQEEGQCAKVAPPHRGVVACKSAGAGAETATLAPPRRALHCPPLGARRWHL